MGMLCWFWKPYVEEEEGVFGEVLEGAPKKWCLVPFYKILHTNMC
jgi:hypothetical protein